MKWVTMWGNAQATVLPYPAVYAKDVTFRYPIFLPFSGNKIRITLDNFCCDEAVLIDKVCVGIGKSLTDEIIKDSYILTCNGKKEFYLEAHGMAESDPLDISVEEDTYLIVSFYLKSFTNLSSGVDIVGPLSKGYFAYGDQTLSKRLDVNTSKSTSWVYFLANIDVYTEDDKEAIVCYGDSITSQDWPDYLLLQLRENGYKNYSVVRKAVSGTRVLREYSCITYQSYGKHGVHRFIHEVGSVSSATKIIIQHGINDIIHPVGEEKNIFRPMSDLPSASELIAGLKYYEQEARALELDVYFGTLLPIYNWRTYEVFRETLKNEVNAWIREQQHIDFENEIGICVDGAYHFKKDCDSGDHLHPSKIAYFKMGNLACKMIISSKNFKI